jgi:tetratricopeptide (TPR) repeat protein
LDFYGKIFGSNLMGYYTFSFKDSAGCEYHCVVEAATSGCSRNGEQIEIRPTAFKLLVILLEAAFEGRHAATYDKLLAALPGLKGQPTTYKELLAALRQGRKEDKSVTASLSTLSTHIKELRDKIAAGVPDNTFIKSIYTVGYRFVPIVVKTGEAAPIFEDRVADSRIDERIGRILEFQEQQLKRAEGEKRIAEEEVCTARAEKQKWVNKYIKLLEDVVARKEVPGESSLAELLEAGDLDGAIRLKTAQIEKREGEVKKLAHDWFELGRVHELRFAWPDVMECYSRAWQLDRDDPGYGFQYAYFAEKQKRFGDAINVYLEALSTYRRLAEANPEAYLPRVGVAATLNNLGILYSVAERMKEAETAYLEAFSTFRRLAEADPEAYWPRVGVATTLNNLGILYSATERMKEAETAYLEALSTQWLLTEANPKAYLQFAKTLNNLGNLYFATERMKKAEMAYLEALKPQRLMAEVAEADPEAYLPDVAETLTNLGNLYRDTGRMKEAETAYLEVLSTYRRLAEANLKAYLPDVAETLTNLGILYSATERMKEAETAYLEALSTFRRLAEANPEAYLPRVTAALATTLNNLGILYRATERMKEAEEYCGAGQAICEPLWRQQPEVYGNLMARIFLLQARLASTDRPGEACDYARGGIEAAFDAVLKQELQSMVDRFCG